MLQLIYVILALYVISLIEVEYTKTLECVPRHFFLTVANVLPLEEVTKRARTLREPSTFRLVSPTIILVKILLQHLWEEKRACDVPSHQQLHKRRRELQLLLSCHIPTSRMSNSYPYSCTVLVMHHSCLTLV